MDLEDRYSRQVRFAEIGEAGQRKLAAAQVAIVGCGATGSVLAGLLARMSSTGSMIPLPKK